MKKALVCGAGGFIGSHMVKRLKKEGFWVRGVDLKDPPYEKSHADSFILGDLRDPGFAIEVIDNEFDEIYQFAADMGGAGFIFTGENDADIMHNSSLININLLRGVTKYFNIEKVKIFYSSSACIYPEEIQQMTENVSLKETDAYPANPDSEYGWEKLFSERLYLSYQKNYKMNTRIARFHNIYGPQGTWKGGREKVPAAVCRKVAEARNGENIEIWGDGEQARSFLYIEDCIEATRRLMESQVNTPINIGSEEMVTINQLVKIVAENANKKILVNHIDGPLGVRGRNSNNDLIRKELDWDYKYSLKDGIKITYDWISQQILNLNS